ncbi:energy transducer TonB family protein [Novosphingobium humi]|uniref:energy transducer TonB family protein n=1 Tax=Novosphingobium humi TaxID=2282397 RepID=UPI0025B0A3F0|nr:energy transducer TonB [Novosphingobium humi]WJT00700.1 energy transducer TonB [Novosphingobium humi]
MRRERLAGAGAAALVHGLALGAALAFSGNPSQPRQRDRAAITAITFSAPAPRPSGRGSAARPAAAIHQSQNPRPTGVSTGISIAAPPALSPAVAAIVAPVPPAPPPPGASPAAPPVKADLSAQRSAYLHRIWLRIMACRPGGLGLAGTVRLAFRLDETGALARARVVGSSGMVLLDRAALQALRRAAPFPAPPEEMRTDMEDFEVEIRFG